MFLLCWRFLLTVAGQWLCWVYQQEQGLLESLDEAGERFTVQTLYRCLYPQHN